MLDGQSRVSPNEEWLQVGQSALWAVTALGVWLAFAGLVPGPDDAVAEALSDEGSASVTSSVRRHIETGRGLYVADVEVTFAAGARLVTAELQHVGRSVEEDEIVPRDGPDWGDGPYEWWEEADEIPPGSRYAPPLEIRYLPDDPRVVMAQADVEDALEQARSDPRAALFLTPLAVALLVRPVRRVAFRRRGRWPSGKGPRPRPGFVGPAE